MSFTFLSHVHFKISFYEVLLCITSLLFHIHIKFKKENIKKGDVQSLLQQNENIIKAHKSVQSTKGEEDNLGPNGPNTKIGAKAKFIGLLFLFVN
jgi:hypothetical protein